MDIRTILVGASGGAASEGAIDLACRLAIAFGAHLEALHVKADPRSLADFSDGAIGMVTAGDIFDKFVADTDELAAKTQASFRSALTRHGLPIAEAPAAAKDAASAAWREDTGEGATLLARRARFFDLVILGRSDRVLDQPHSQAVEQTLLESGRAIILAPGEVGVEIGATIAIGWNGSPGSVRAVTAALPLLARARRVLLVTVGEENEEDVAGALEWLGWRGIAATRIAVPSVAGVRPGVGLLAGAREAGADLLVMGAFGRRPWREHFFGGATAEIAKTSLLPLLLAH